MFELPCDGGMGPTRSMLKLYKVYSFVIRSWVGILLELLILTLNLKNIIKESKQAPRTSLSEHLQFVFIPDFLCAYIRV